MPRRYPEFIQGENVVWRKVFYSDNARTTLVDPSTVTLTLESPSGTVHTPSITHASLGVYLAGKVMDEYGNWDWRWVTTSPIHVDQGTIVVVQKNVP